MSAPPGQPGSAPAASTDAAIPSPLEAGGGVLPGNLVWILGHPRSGSSWLAQMLSDMPGWMMWNEPLVGRLFGEFWVEKRGDLRNKSFFLAPELEDVWLRGIRDLIVDGARARYPTLDENGFLVIKEPHGSVGAPQFLAALPESRVIVLVRDPRDAIASALDGQSETGWTQGGPRHRKLDLPKPKRGADFVKHRSERLVIQVGGALRGFDAHPGPKILITYEQLRGKTKETMRRIGSELELPADGAELDAIVDKHAWENVPEEEKGEGKIRRKAKPGGWQDDLTPEQVSTIEELAKPIFDRFYAG
jgi:hypothetical protein